MIILNPPSIYFVFLLNHIGRDIPPDIMAQPARGCPVHAIQNDSKCVNLFLGQTQRPAPTEAIIGRRQPNQVVDL